MLAQQLLVMTLHMIDLLAAFKMSKAVVDKCEKNRVKQKKEATAKKMAIEQDLKEEVKRKELQLEKERVKKMTPDQQKKYEEK